MIHNKCLETNKKVKNRGNPKIN